jgi:hypothetical protein
MLTSFNHKEQFKKKHEERRTNTSFNQPNKYEKTHLLIESVNEQKQTPS